MRTPLVMGFVATSMAFLFLGVLLRSWQVLVLSLPPLLFLAVGTIAAPPRPLLTAQRVVSRDRLQVGSELQIDLTLRNDGPNLDLLEVVDLLPPEFRLESGTNQAVVPLAPGETFAFSCIVRPALKGEYSLGPVRARAIDPLGLGAEDATVPVTTRVLVAPPLEDMRHVRFAPRRTRPWFGQIPSKRPGLGSEFWAVREYASGDELRRINWKATARLDRPLTNEYVGERSGDVVIVLDARQESFVGTRLDNPVEHGVRAALGIADHVLSARNRAGLVVARNVLDRVLPAFGRKQLFRILEALVRVGTGGQWPFSHVARIVSRYFPTDAHVVLISPLADFTALQATIGLKAQGYDVLVVSPSPLDIQRALVPKSDAQNLAYRILREERANLLLQLRRVSEVVDWDPRTPLALPFRRLGRSIRAP